MANNYLEFSEVIENLTSKEIKWWDDEIQRIEDKYDDEDNWPANYDPCEDESMCNDFCLEKANKSVWFHSDESGDVEKIACIVQKFLAKFRRTEYFCLTWACWCSKPRIGEFDGGAMFVTAHEVKFHNAYEWISERKDEWEEDHGV